MVFNSTALIILFILLIIWLVVVSYFLLRMIRHYNTLTRDISDHGLKAILEQILKRQQTVVNQAGQLRRDLDETKRQGYTHIQKMGLIRFNPFSDTGGSQSFTLALLDASDNGMVMTSLYARTGNRWYIKEVRGGKGKELALSEEEESAVRNAKTI